MSKRKAGLEPRSRAGARTQADRWEEKRQRFADERYADGRPRRLRTTTYVTIGGILLAVFFIGMMTFRNSESSPAGPALQQAAGTTGAVAAGKVTISAEEVQTKRLVAWDYNQGNTKVPLIAYVTPSGAMKVAVRMCEPCNSTSFRVEGTQLVCNACGSRWELETSKGISGGCLGYPPDVLQTTLADGKLLVDEQTVSNWKRRV